MNAIKFTNHTTSTLPGRIGTVCVLIIAGPLLGGCIGPSNDVALGACTTGAIIDRALDRLSAVADPDGGVPGAPGADTDTRSTSWVLLASALARRAGHEGRFDPRPHIDHLLANLDDLEREGSPSDSAANNLSLARAALKAWGKPGTGIRMPATNMQGADGNETSAVRTLASAWEARYDQTTGRYGTRPNEHVFGAFATIVFEPPGPRRQAMSDHVGDPASNIVLREQGQDAYTFDAWYAAYARIALGPGPSNESLSAATTAALVDHRDPASGGLIGFATSKRPDASTTAAALTSWALVPEGAPDHDAIEEAVGFLCSLQDHTGTVRFAAGRTFAPTKTTAETVIALALTEEPIPWTSDDPSRT